MRSRVIGSLVCAAIALLIVGCPAQPAKPIKSNGTGTGPRGDGTAITAEEPPKEEPASTPDTPTTDTPTTDTPDKPAPEEAPPQAAAAVLLGDPSLTAGIPGEGPLSVEEIRAFLDQKPNHEPLSIQLPFGLDRGADQVKGLDQNPLTRAKIELGRQLYFDTRLSADNTVACASCHHPDHGYARETQFGVGIGQQMGNRNSPISYNRILSDKQFWDGRAESLEAQAIGPIANPIEMGNTHEACVETLAGLEGYRMQFDAIFGEGGLNIENVGKAIASFERVIVTGPSPFDYGEALRAYANIDVEELKEDDPDAFAEFQKLSAAAEAQPMSDAAKRGREIFFTEKGGCTQCHVGPNLADEKYHNLGVGMDAEKPDAGRFNVTMADADIGAFKTPTIRNVALTAPYMHDGSQKTLEEVIEWYAKGGHPNPHLSNKIKKLQLSDQDKKDLVEFMKACTGEFPKVETGRLPK